MNRAPSPTRLPAHEAYLAATAGRMVEEGIREERRRMAVSPNPGRRMADVLASVGVPEFVTAADVVVPSPWVEEIRPLAGGRTLVEWTNEATTDVIGAVYPSAVCRTLDEARAVLMGDVEATLAEESD